MLKVLLEIDKKKLWAARRARGRILTDRIKAAEEEKAMDKDQFAGPPPFAQTADNWRLTPLSDEQFDFVYDSIQFQKQEKAEKINGRMDAEDAIPIEEIPVLTWASPKEFERLLDYAKKMREERDEARLVCGALHALGVNRAGVTKVNQTIQDALLLNERLSGAAPIISPGRYPPPETQQSA